MQRGIRPSTSPAHRLANAGAVSVKVKINSTARERVGNSKDSERATVNIAATTLSIVPLKKIG